MDDSKIIYKDLSYQVVGILFEVYNELGYGYHEKYYTKAIEKYLRDEKIKYAREVPYKISVKGEVIGRNYLDFLIDDKIVLEIKRGSHFSKRNLEQIKQYLKLSGKKLAILANYTPNGVKFHRVLNIK